MGDVDAVAGLLAQFDRAAFNGRLARGQWAELVQDLLGESQREAADVYFRGIDMDGDGYVSRAEFEEFVGAILKKDAEYAMKMAFRAFDTDRSGKLEAGEIVKIGMFGSEDQEPVDINAIRSYIESVTGDRNGGLTYAQCVKLLTGRDIPPETSAYGAASLVKQSPEDEALEVLTKPNEDGISVLQHIGQTLNYLVDFGADRPLDYFEPFSYMIKEARQSRKHLAELALAKGVWRFVEKVNALRRQQLNLFASAPLAEEGEEEEQKEAKDEEKEESGEQHAEEETQNEADAPDILQDNEFIANVGIGLTDTEGLQLQRSLVRMVKRKPVVTARFWGKVQTLVSAYYVAECEFQDGARQAPESKEEEEKGEGSAPKVPKVPVEEGGPNAQVYCVTSDLSGKWTVLPDVTPQQIVGSRSVSQPFSGDLLAPVVTDPPGRFEGTERNLLRAFIARVRHSTTVAAKGRFEATEGPNEEEEELGSNAPIAEKEEWVAKPVVGLDSFVHVAPAILPQGRCEFWAPEVDEDKPQPKPEKGPPILSPITQDQPPWSLRTFTYPEKLFWLRSNVWPGLSVVADAKGQRVVTVYFGWGMKNGEPLPWPPLPEPPKPVVKPSEEEEQGEGTEKGGEGDGAQGGAEASEGEGYSDYN